MLKHITIVVLQDVQSEIKIEAEEYEDTDIKVLYYPIGSTLNQGDQTSDFWRTCPPLL